MGQMTEAATLQSGADIWALWQKPLPEVVYPVQALSPSAISRFLKCPRQFYYQDVLRLVDNTPTPEATLGSLTHQLLEVFYRRPLAEQTPDTLAGWTAQAVSERQLKAFADLKTLSRLQQAQILRRLQSGLDDFAGSLGQAEVVSQVWVEHRFDGIAIPDVPGLILKGRADLIREYPGGRLEIVDFKTSRSQYIDNNPDKNRKNLLNALSATDWQTPEPERYRNRHYQLPLYWLMALASPEFQGRQIDITIQVIREKRFDIPGSISFTVRHEELEAGRPHLIELLQKGVVEPMQLMQHYLPLGDAYQDCRFCSYQSICNRDSEEAFE